METKRPYICVCACRHVAAPYLPGEGCQFLPLVRGSVYYTGGPGPHGGSGTLRWSGPPREVRSPRLFGLSACFFRNTWCSQTFPSRGTGPGPLSGEQGSGPQGSGCLDVVKDNHKVLA